MIVSVVPLRPVAKSYSYLVPAGEQPTLGQIVRIPFGKKDGEPTLGVIWSLEGDQTVDRSKLKTLTLLNDWPPISDNLRQFIDWSAHYTVSALGSFMRMALPISDVLRPTPTQTRYKIGTSAPKTLTAARQKVIDLLEKGGMLTRVEIHAATGVSDSVIKALATDGLIEAVTVSAESEFETTVDPLNINLPDYNPPQQKAADQLVDIVKANDFSVSLLDGVTGSGKTEVYFAAVKQALAQHKQVLILVPEIALTTQFIERFTKRFGVAPVAWHSHLTPAQRRRNLKAIVHGQAQVILGARSALFLPHRALGLIVVDEEHDSSYKQEEGVYYNARDLAIKRAQIEQFPVILVSATPSLETYHNAQSGRYDWIKLPTRFAAAELPEIKIIDMRAQKMKRTEFLSAQLLESMKETLAKNEQVMLYLNRRGYAPLTLCRTCGHRIECPRCTAWMVQHRTNAALMCHHCGWHMASPKKCPSCDTPDSLVACGPGVERIEDEVKLHFPDKRVAILSSDTHKSMAALSDTLHQIENKEVDILIGTQIVAKGHHFPMLTLVGIVDADLGLGGGDLRAGERTFQVLQQVSGRAGRGDRPGHVMLQSFIPDHRVIQSLAHGQRDEFLEVETHERVQSHMPPAGRLAGIIISSKDEIKAKRFADELSRVAPVSDAIRILGPAPAPMFRVRLNYRFRLLVKANKDQNIQRFILEWLSRAKTPSGVRVQVDIDPYSFM
jgi:primosomal protein N' (replication factor Y) (superfamily II helicase)